ncbi:hypothetical protein GIB67_041148 [Kingdonia uniflora]|uniref:Non-specific lipid-transfer protein n=1 Tax=Kingdonia uniflora TaxID=39325 RepID=A0A7J7LKL8_9MAGN|nr:hypothetical protein GIB67_041148 [Kingdonia uniflora]
MWPSGEQADTLYLLRSDGNPTAGCCAGVRGFNNVAKTTPDCQTACKCIKSTSRSIAGIKPAFSSSLPGKCGVSIPYKISPSTDCINSNRTFTKGSFVLQGELR